MCEFACLHVALDNRLTDVGRCCMGYLCVDFDRCMLRGCIDLRVVVMGVTWLVLLVRMVFTLVMTYELPQSELWCGRVHLT